MGAVPDPLTMLTGLFNKRVDGRRVIYRLYRIVPIHTHLERVRVWLAVGFWLPPLTSNATSNKWKKMSWKIC